MAEEKSNFGKIVKRAIREMWALEYEVDELQHKFADSIGKMDLDNLDVDFIEDMMLKAKPLQTVLNCIRNRQITKLEEIKGIYADKIKVLEPMKVSRPAKPEPKPADAPVAAAPPPPPLLPRHNSPQTSQHLQIMITNRRICGLHEEQTSDIPPYTQRCVCHTII